MFKQIIFVSSTCETYVLIPLFLFDSMQNALKWWWWWWNRMIQWGIIKIKIMWSQTSYVRDIHLSRRIVSDYLLHVIVISYQDCKLERNISCVQSKDFKSLYVSNKIRNSASPNFSKSFLKIIHKTAKLKTYQTKRTCQDPLTRLIHVSKQN